MIKSYIAAACLISSSFIQAQVFQQSTQSFEGVFYGDCAVSDLNADGQPDFMISGAKPGYSGYSGVFYNTNAQFATTAIPDLSPIMYSAIAIDDINGDTRKDFVVTGTRTDITPVQTVFEIYTQNTDGTFTKNANSGIAGANFGSVQLADFNDDGRKDIFVNGMANTKISKIYLQQQNGSFLETDSGLMGTQWSDTKSVDVNNDGSPDLLITGFNSENIPVTKLYTNSGIGEFTELGTNIPGLYFSSIDTADINNDGNIDLLVSGLDATATYHMQIYLNDGSGVFTSVPANFTGTALGSSKFVDYNKDGFIDVFSIGATADDETKVQFYKNNGDMTFTFDAESSNQITGLTTAKAEWFDIDADGDKDLITIGFDGELAHTYIYSNNFVPTGPCAEPGQEPGDTGCVIFTYKGVQTYLTTVRGSDGKIWLQQNLGSINVASAVADPTSYGDLFQWGRWDDGHQSRTSLINGISTPNNPTGLNQGSAYYLTGSTSWWSANALTDTWEAATPADATATNGCDPCKALGEGWKLPTQEDWTAIVASEQIANPATAFSSVLKLPGNGYRSSTTGSFTFVGTKGYYWSSTSGSAGAKYLYIGTTLANPASGASRGQGAAIRCLKNESVLGINNPATTRFSLYPNPTSNVFNIQTELGVENISVYNQLGQLITSQVKPQVNLSNAASGIYVVRITFDNGQTAVQKIIKK